ncbi:MAG: hypothetical protein ACI841_003721, partial [Planctomycetota bacterium]
MSLALATLLVSITPISIALPPPLPLLSTARRKSTAPVGNGWHENPRFGFKIKAPAKFNEVPIKIDENWLAARFLSEKFDIWINPDTRYDYNFKPTLTVIGFLEREEEGDFFDDVEEKEEEAEDPEGEGDDDEPGRITISGKAFADYEDYLDRTYSGGGFFVASKEESKHGKIPITKFEIKVEKLSYDGPKRITTWVYHCDGLDLAVQFEILETTVDKYTRSMKSTFKSFKTIERVFDEPLDQSGVNYITLSELTRGTPAENAKKRKISEEKLRERASAAVTDGWTAQAISDCYVINHTDERYAKKVVERCEAVMTWLDKTFPEVGPDEYVRGPIIRICADNEEENAYRQGSSGWWNTGLEIVTHKANNSWLDWELESTNQQIFQHWFRERDYELYLAMPAWLQEGLSSYVKDLRVKGRKVDARPDSWDRDWLRRDSREGKASQPRDIMRRSKKDYS